MELSVFSLMFLSFFAFSFSIVSSQTDSCSSNLAVSSLIPFNSSSFNCFTAWKTQSFTLRYAKSSNNKWSFVLSAPDSNAYIAIGFSSNGKMVGSSAVVGWVSSGKGTVNQYYLGGFSSSQCQPGKGDLNVVKNSTVIVSQSSMLYLAFEITINQPTPYLIYAIGPNGNLPSSNGYLSAHQHMASASFNATAGSKGGGEETEGEEEEGEEEEGTEEGEHKDKQSARNDVQSSGGFGDKQNHALLVILMSWGVLAYFHFDKILVSEYIFI